MTLFQLYQDVQAAKKEEQQDRAALFSLRRQIKDAAEGLITQAREDAGPLVSRFYEELTQPVEALERRVTEIRQQREALVQEVRSLDARSRAELRRTSADNATGRW